ncbi:hypothetical protein ACU6U9_20960 [Pseudomonas sp. HK3]
MSTLVFQLVLKQWDKSQRRPEHQAAIASTADIYPIASQPEFMLFDMPCVLDQHALDFTTEPLESINAERLSEKNAGRIISKTLLPDGRAQLDRFIISHTEQQFHLAYEDEEGEISHIANLNKDSNNSWVQAKYQWRYRIEKNNEIYWQYEEVTLNTAWVEQVKPVVFLMNPPAVIFNGV